MGIDMNKCISPDHLHMDFKKVDFTSLYLIQVEHQANEKTKFLLNVFSLVFLISNNIMEVQLQAGLDLNCC